MKKVLTTVAIILAVYFSFLSFDCIRLKTADGETIPLITLNVSETENRTEYVGLGYSVEYYKDNSNGSIYGAEFRLFDKIMIWAWIE